MKLFHKFSVPFSMSKRPWAFVLAASLSLGSTSGWTSDAPPPLGKPAVTEGVDEAPIVSTSTALPMGRKPGATEEPTSEHPENTVPTPVPAGHSASPFTSIENAVSYILSQRGFDGQGLPATYYVPAGTTFSDPHEQLIVTEGVGFYDTSVAIITLIEGHHWPEARHIVDTYLAGLYATSVTDPLELRAYPTTANHQSFSPFDPSTYYFFDFTNVYGRVHRWGSRWDFWGAHTGPNAWFANAVSRLILEGRHRHMTDLELAPYLSLADTVGRAMLRLQDTAGQSGVRYGPQGTYHPEGSSDPFDTINSENNLSTYAAFQMLYRATKKRSYRLGADRILDYFKNAKIVLPNGTVQQGLMDAATSTLGMGVTFENGRWKLQEGHPTDAGGTWAISSLGPKTIDSTWGRGTAFRMWRTVRQRSGRTSDFGMVQDGGTLAGLDYNDAYPASESLITPEWTAGGLYALQALVDYYGKGHRGISASNLQSLKDDLASVQAFMKTHSNAYAYGPGHHGSRDGQTGFGWKAPPENVDAMASVYLALFYGQAHDPLGAWRDKSL